MSEVIAMQRYFIKSHDSDKQTVYIKGDDAHHIRDVMRMETGRQIELVIDNEVYLGVIQTIERDRIKAEIVRELKETSKTLPVTLALALIRKTPFEFALQKTVELGIAGFVPLRMDHSVVKITNEKADKKTKRYQTIAKEASEQCKRHQIPHVDKPRELEELDFDAFDEVIVPYERNNPADSLRHHLRAGGKELRRLVIIGPEGGFSPGEIDYLKKRNAVFVSLGKTILRAETAAIYAIGGIRYEYD